MSGGRGNVPWQALLCKCPVPPQTSVRWSWQKQFLFFREGNPHQDKNSFRMLLDEQNLQKADWKNYCEEALLLEHLLRLWLRVFKTPWWALRKGLRSSLAIAQQSTVTTRLSHRRALKTTTAIKASSCGDGSGQFTHCNAVLYGVSAISCMHQTNTPSREGESQKGFSASGLWE